MISSKADNGSFLVFVDLEIPALYTSNDAEKRDHDTVAVRLNTSMDSSDIIDAIMYRGNALTEVHLSDLSFNIQWSGYTRNSHKPTTCINLLGRTEVRNVRRC